MQRHELKCWPAAFQAIRAGVKSFEVRVDDRGFNVHDIVVLREFDPESQSYTGQSEERSIREITSEDAYGVSHGFVVLGYSSVPRPTDLPVEAVKAQDVIAWHENEGQNALLRADNSRRTAQSYRANGAPALAASAEKYEAMASLATQTAQFHISAAGLLREAYGLNELN